VTADAELQEKSSSDVKNMVDQLLSQCQQAIKEHDDKTSNTAVTATQQTQSQTTAERECVTHTWSLLVLLLAQVNNLDVVAMIAHCSDVCCFCLSQCCGISCLLLLALTVRQSHFCIMVVDLSIILFHHIAQRAKH